MKTRGLAMIKIGEVGCIEKELPVCGPMDAICRPLAVAPCSSDVHTVWEGALGERGGIILGHEGVGEVVEVGCAVKDFKPGDKVIVPAVTPNWSGLNSQAGFHTHDELLLGGWKLSNTKDGVFGTYFHVNDADGNLAHLPEGMSLEAAVMICDMVPTGFHAVELVDIQYGDNVAVIGIGPVGLMSVQAAALHGAAKIFAVGSRKVCVNLAHEFGATDVIDYHNGDILEQIMDLTNGEGVDRVVIAGGNNDTFIQAVNMLKPGGVIGNVNFLGEGDYIRIPRVGWGCGMGDKTIRGSVMPGGRLKMEKYANLAMSGRIHPEKLITHRFHGMDSVEESLLLMRDKPRDLIKPIVYMD